MSRENVEVVRGVFEAFRAGLARGDPGEAFASDFMRTWTEDFDRWSIELEELIDAGDDQDPCAGLPSP